MRLRTANTPANCHASGEGGCKLWPLKYPQDRVLLSRLPVGGPHAPMGQVGGAQPALAPFRLGDRTRLSRPRYHSDMGSITETATGYMTRVDVAEEIISAIDKEANTGLMPCRINSGPAKIVWTSNKDLHMSKASTALTFGANAVARIAHEWKDSGWEPMATAATAAQAALDGAAEGGLTSTAIVAVLSLPSGRNNTLWRLLHQDKPSRKRSKGAKKAAATRRKAAKTVVAPVAAAVDALYTPEQLVQIASSLPEGSSLTVNIDGSVSIA